MATPLTIRANNPGALRPSKEPWIGQTGTTPGAVGSFVVFESPVYGVRAFFKNARTQINRGFNTVETFITRYAPQTENDTNFYIGEVAKTLGARNTALDFQDKKQMIALAKVIFAVESGRRSGWEKTFTDDIISKGYDMAIETTTTTPKDPKKKGEDSFLIYILLAAAAVFLYYKFIKK